MSYGGGISVCVLLPSPPIPTFIFFFTNTKASRWVSEWVSGCLFYTFILTHSTQPLGGYITLFHPSFIVQVLNVNWVTCIMWCVRAFSLNHSSPSVFTQWYSGRVSHYDDSLLYHKTLRCIILVPPALWTHHHWQWEQSLGPVFVCTKLNLHYSAYCEWRLVL